MSKAEELAKSMESMLALEPEDHQVIAHLLAIDASHRQLLEALEACLVKGSRWHTCDPIVTQARTAIAAAKELQ